MTTKELCNKFNIDEFRLTTAKHYIQLDVKTKPVVAFDRKVAKDGSLTNEWIDVTELKQLDYEINNMEKNNVTL